MSNSHQFAIMSRHSGQKNYHEVCAIIYRILQYPQLTLERAPCLVTVRHAPSGLINDISLIIMSLINDRTCLDHSSVSYTVLCYSLLIFLYEYIIQVYCWDVKSLVLRLFYLPPDVAKGV